MAKLCIRCEVIFPVNRRPLYSNEPWEYAASSWGRYADLHKATASGCVLCQRVRRAFLEFGVDLTTEHTDRSPGDINYTLDRNSLSFQAVKYLQKTMTVKFQLSTPPDNPLHSMFPRCTVSADSSSDACFDLAKGWLKTCLKTHSGCPNQQMLLPSRVIDVGNDKQEPHLHIAGGEELGHWLTLSHCWGTYHTITTTTSSLEAHCRSLELASLPETFRDAVFITRRLGYQYLWIDSLCIVQDSAHDWNVESEKMASIYMNAVLNISADASGSDSQGIFKSAAEGRFNSEHLALPCFVSGTFIESTGKEHALSKIGLGKLGQTRIVTTKVYASSDEHLAHHKHTLQQRGWVLQESVLSRRFLRYVQGGLHWSCAEGTANEVLPKMAPKKVTDRTNFAYCETLHEIPHIDLSIWKLVHPHNLEYLQDDSDGDRLRQLEWWYNKVNSYVGRKLTFPKDRIPAILGLANEFSRRNKFTFRCGIWLEDFRRGILWQGPTSPAYLAHYPSWSWAAVDEKRVLGPYDFSVVRNHGKYFNCELINTPLRYGYDEKSGTLGILTLRGYTRPFESFCPDLEFCKGPISESKNLKYRLVDPDEQVTSTPYRHVKLGLMGGVDYPYSLNNLYRPATTHDLWLDIPLLPAQAASLIIGRKAVAIRIANLRGSWNWWTYYLILEPVPELVDTFRRLGVLRVLIDQDSGDRDEPAAFNESAYELRTVNII